MFMLVSISHTIIRHNPTAKKTTKSNHSLKNLFTQELRVAITNSTPPMNALLPYRIKALRTVLRNNTGFSRIRPRCQSNSDAANAIANALTAPTPRRVFFMILWSRAFRLGSSDADAPSSNRACGFPAHGFPCETGVIGISFL